MKETAMQFGRTATFAKVLVTLILLVVTAMPPAVDEFSFDFQAPSVFRNWPDTHERHCERF